MRIRLRLKGVVSPALEHTARVILFAQLLHFFFPSSPWTTALRVSRDYVRARPKDNRSVRFLLDAYVVERSARLMHADPSLARGDARLLAAVALWETRRLVMAGPP